MCILLVANRVVDRTTRIPLEEERRVVDQIMEAQSSWGNIAGVASCMILRREKAESIEKKGMDFGVAVWATEGSGNTLVDVRERDGKGSWCERGNN